MNAVLYRQFLFPLKGKLRGQHCIVMLDDQREKQTRDSQVVSEVQHDARDALLAVEHQVRLAR